MSRFFLVMGILFAFPAFANAAKVSLDMEFSVDSKLVSTPHMVVQLGTKAVVQQVVDGTAYTIEVLPTRKNKDFLELRFVVRETANGKTSVLSRPHLITLNHQAASIEQKVENQPTFKLKVVPVLN